MDAAELQAREALIAKVKATPPREVPSNFVITTPVKQAAFPKAKACFKPF